MEASSLAVATEATASDSTIALVVGLATLLLLGILLGGMVLARRAMNRYREVPVETPENFDT